MRDRETLAEGFRTYTRAIDSLEQNAEEGILSRLYGRAGLAILNRTFELPQSWREVRLYLLPERFYAGYLGVRGEYDAPWELRRDLQEKVPQANLRDTYRMLWREEPVEWRRDGLGMDPGGRAALAEGREGLRREPAPVIEPLTEAVMAEQERRRRFLKEPWPAHLPDDSPRVYPEADPFAEADSFFPEPAP